VSIIDLSKLPQSLGQNVARFDPQTGLATQAVLDNEFYLETVIKSQLGALDHAALTAQSTADTAQANVTIEATTRANADSALAAAIISAEARATGGSAATAQMQLVATAGVGGATAEFSWELRASGTNYPVGMTAYVSSGGVGSISFTAEAFQLTDPSYAGGVPGNVFEYSSGFWRFNVPVELVTGELALNAVTDIAFNAGTISSGGSLSVSKSFYGGTDAIILVCLEPASSLSPTPVQTYALNQRTYTVALDVSTLVGTMAAYDVAVAANMATVRDAAGAGTTNVVGALYWGPQGLFKSFNAVSLAAGSHSFSVTNPYTEAMDARIIVLEPKR
jgi:hypothetical protein